jgi:phosphoglycolate phosphatase
LVLFDIDGTLVDVRGAGRRSFIRALRDTWSIDDTLDDVRFGGATDLGVLAQLRQRLDLDTESEAAFFRNMERALAAELSTEKPLVYAGVHACLARLTKDVDVTLGFVTGNAMRCAFVKVEQAGLDRSVFDVGGYGDEHPDRNELARLARTRAESAQGPFERVLLIGDTPSDVRAAKAIGAVAVAVTTGHASRAALEACGADVIVDSLDVVF